MGRPGRARRGERRAGEDGAILILALAFLTAVSLAVLMLSGWATNDLNNSAKFSSANSLTLAASDMMNEAIQYVRYNPVISSSQAVGVPSPVVACWGGEETKLVPVIDGDQVAVWCSTVWEPLSYQTRDVTFDACPIDVSAAACRGSNVLLATEVIFDDYPPAPASSAPIQNLCTVWCGSGMTVSSWGWGSSVPISTTGLASELIFSGEPSDTSVGASTATSVTVKDAGGNPVAGDTVGISEQSGPQDGISASSNLTAVTDSSGVATFTNIVLQYVGNYTLIASDGGASAISSNFVVTTQKSVITVTSKAPTNATQNGPTYTPTATATSFDAVVITVASSSSGVCVITSGVVSFKGLGTCTLDFNDPAAGNPNYAPAAQVTQSFPVGGLAATQVGLALSTNTPTASSTTNVTITLTLENAVGVPVNSSGTTTVVLSDIGDGDFATKLGTGIASSTQTLNVSFTNGTGTATAYFLDENTGPDTITAVNGTSNWGTASLTVQAGAPAQVSIAPSTASPTVSSVTSTSLTFQLEDQLGNAATSSTGLTLTLSDSNKGFFATANGVAGTSTLSVTFASGAGTASAYYGNTTAGADMITAKNGTTAWGSTTVTPAAGAASSVQITVSPAAPAQSTTTNATVSVQLVDQYGNDVPTPSGVSLTLSNSGSGFFATGSGSTGTATLALTTSTSGFAKGYFGDDVSGQSVTITVTGSGISATTPPFII
ncbi:MAG: hypothetical protein WCA31_01445 [Acidimicrobiales bacterium]